MFWLIVGSVVALIFGNLTIRAGMLKYQYSSWSLRSFVLNWQVWLGACLVLAGLITWLLTAIVGRYEWSYVSLGLSFVLTIVCAWWFLGETLTLEKMFGAIILVVGMVLLIRNSGF